MTGHRTRTLDRRWVDHAACASRPDLPWDTSGDATTSRGSTPGAAEALDLCRRSCPVRAECLAETDLTETTASDTTGIRGGLTAPQRRARRRSSSTTPVELGAPDRCTPGA